MTIYAVTADGIPIIFFAEQGAARAHVSKCIEAGVHRTLGCVFEVRPVYVHGGDDGEE